MMRCAFGDEGHATSSYQIWFLFKLTYFLRDQRMHLAATAGKKPGKSGGGNFGRPQSHFGTFVKICVQMLPDHSEFRRDFPRSIARANFGGLFTYRRRMGNIIFRQTSFCRAIYVASRGAKKTIEALAATAIDKRKDLRKQLQQFYVDGAVFVDADLPKNISDEDFKNYNVDADQWATNTANWIGEHLGPAAKAKFLDRSSMPYLIHRKSVNDAHNGIINAITKFRKNLSTLIETGAWDDRE